MSKESPTQSRSLYSAIFLAAALYVFIKNFSTLSPILLSFILILLLTLAINPLILKLRRRLTGGRTLATAFVVVIFLAIVVLTGFAFYTPIKRSTGKFVEQLPQYWQRIQKPILKIEQKAAISEQKLKKEVTTEVQREDPSLQTNAPAPPPTPPPVEPDSAKTPAREGFLRSGIGSVFSGVSSSFKVLASNAASLVLVVITVFFGVVFTLLRPRPVIRTFYEIIPEQHHERAVKIARRIVEFVPRWALATLTGMTIIGLMIFLAMWPLVGFQDALVLGLIALVFEAVPYIGPILAAVPALLLAVGHGGLLPLWVLLAYLCVQAFENNIIMPVVVGGQLRMHPVAVIFSMLFCVGIFGVLGVLIALPMLAIAKIFHEEIYRPKFLPNVSDAELEHLAQATLERTNLKPAREKASEKKPPEAGLHG
ncbi:MAG: AI-2E family transporter [Verrucomicrobiota bacterium]